MKHYDQHTIELYVLGSTKVETLKAGLEEHMKECYTCRQIADDLHQFYTQVGGSRPLLAERKVLESTDSLVLKPEYISRVKLQHTRSVTAKIWTMAKAYPTRSSFVSLLAIAMVVVTMKSCGLFRDTNPTDAMLSDIRGGLVVYNKENEILWQIHQSNTTELINQQKETKFRYAQTSDINGDGTNEVITSLAFSSEDREGRYLRVLNDKREVIVEKAFGAEQLTFGSESYNVSFEIFYPLILNISGQKTKEIIVGASNRRSPTFFARMDHKGNVLGRYWHYGQLGASYLAHPGQDGSNVLILCGVNDVDEYSTGRKTVIAVLDPAKIIGDGESKASRGFGFESSQAELFYIQIPQPDIAQVTDTKLFIQNLRDPDEPEFHFRAILESDPLLEFEFIFDKEFKIIEVKSGTSIDLLHARLKKEGKISSTLDLRYKKELKNRVKYWNGAEWVSKYARVDYSLKNK